MTSISETSSPLRLRSISIASIGADMTRLGSTPEVRKSLIRANTGQPLAAAASSDAISTAEPPSETWLAFPSSHLTILLEGSSEVSEPLHRGVSTDALVAIEFVHRKTLM